MVVSHSDRLCKNCKHYKKSMIFRILFFLNEFHFDRCHSPQNGFDLINGKYYTISAYLNRRFYGNCGIEGRLYEEINS